jgi:hypothetical protein
MKPQQPKNNDSFSREKLLVNAHLKKKSLIDG